MTAYLPYLKQFENIFLPDMQKALKDYDELEKILHQTENFETSVEKAQAQKK